jgi:hypothetical protein
MSEEMQEQEEVSFGFVVGIVLLLLISGTVLSYYRFFVQHNFPITAQVDCDPEQEACFMYVCNPDVAEEECSGNPEEDTYYYKIVQQDASSVSSCDPLESDCDSVFVCDANDSSCSVTYCTDEILAEMESGDTCSDVEQFGSSSVEDDAESGDGSMIDQELEDMGSGDDEQEEEISESEDVSSEAFMEVRAEE